MKDKTVLITGASKGMGKAMSRRLAEMGAKVYMACKKKEVGVLPAGELQKEGLNVVLKVCDLEKVEDITRLAGELASECDCLDVLINNGAVNLETPESRIENTPIDVLEKTMNINFRGYFLMCQKFIPLLKKSKSGRLINFSSGIGRLTIDKPGYVPVYSISKTAVNAITKNLAHELKDTDIMVFSVDPGSVRTDLGGPDAPLSVDDGIDTPIFLATEPAAHLITGEFYHERKLLSW